ncbi:probable helicase senataxin isoform X1 [Felis catus]|uniref:Senataxin n=1 Tax=Felis catus TaxID=9685 RepID=A0ABI7ZJW8_FELCA|nr:probable helicase senataxin isoform X1 [Felis catus]XP_006939639.1 probable helicase senataxin isoform X1 [Felis catus]XP_023098671.1 probable helicase senataxin isoform X1 [Felis catus]XP_023098672.1 probable helicase senataxin isoform X1 [Felis catus]XP_023098673.1 probable helicase senataxin isoform X1 [Felis catus]XP_023098674.1 probable helicase senataxin isoform X1 [Felis catus]XP_023098675.1 probable helicase senataxin isoform X1 [Felis catus]XP_023098676.1 probable helicase senata
MSTCCWCTPGGISTADFLKRYASRTHAGEFQTADEDLCYCLECVAEYHKARDDLPFLHEVLWELETLRLINHFEKSMKAEIGDDDELYIVDNNGEAQLFDFTGQDFENKLRVPLLEILKYPYLLLHERVNELCVEALCRMEQANCSFQVFDKHPGIYLFLVHPNEMVRRWAILTARNLGKVDRDDYYDLQEVLTCLFKVIELGLLEDPDIYTSSVLEKGKLILLPSHMYDTTNYKNYWLGICMLLTILEEQAMDSLLLGSDKQNDFMQSILHTMERQADDGSVDPFWPALHCFMVILDRLGSKVWGQRIDPIEAFQTIINNMSYNREIQNIRNSSVRTKSEPESYLDDMVTCSQIVYNYNPEKTKKDSGWRSAICPDYCPNMYEEMETLASVLQSDIGQDMRVHNSTFLWFIPFVQSLMDLKDLGVAYIVEVIHHLHSEVKDVLNQTDAVCDKVTEFFLLILVSVIELHRNKKCLHLLWVSSQQWVEAVVKCAKLPTTAFARSSEKSSGNCSKGAAVISSLSLHSMPSNSVQLACVQLIRSLLKEGYQLGQQTLCKRFWDKLNLFLRGNLSLGWQLTTQETHELQTCLKQIIRNIKFKVPQCSTFVDLTPVCKTPPVSYSKEESEQTGKKSKKGLHCLENSSPTFSKGPMKAEAFQMPENRLVKASNASEEDSEHSYIKDLKLEGRLSAESCIKQGSKRLVPERAQDAVRTSKGKQKSVKENPADSRNGPERGCDRGVIPAARSLTDSGTDSLEKASTSTEDFSFKDDVLGKTSKGKTKGQKAEICAKLSHVLKKQHRKSTLIDDGNLEEKLTVSTIDSFFSRKDSGGQKGDGFINPLSLDPDDVPDDKNGERKSQNSLLLKKKQFKGKELDIFSSHENSCQIQECQADGKDLVSFTEMTDTCVKKTSPFKDPVTLLESRDKEVGKSTTSQVSSHLREQVPSLSPQSSTLTDSQIDRDLHNLSLIAQASVIKFPSESTQKSSSQLQRKVKDKRCFTANPNNAGEACRGQVIIISDSDDDDGDEGILGFEKHIKRDKIGIKKEYPEEHTSVASTNVEQKLIKEEEAKSLLEFEESDSQFFEFESPHEVFSVWQDQEPDNKNSVQEDENNSRLTHINDVTNDWGYDTDYVSEEVIKKVAEGFEKHTEPQSGSSVGEFCETEVKRRKRKRYGKPVAEDPLRPSPSERNEDQSDNERGLTENDLKSIELRSSSRSNLQRGTTDSLKKSSPKLRTYSKPVRRVPHSKTKKTHSDTKKGQNKSSSYISCRTTPAIVPPKILRQCPEPTSTVEKLGLKKAPRRAFDLSQRSLGYLVQLRDHGKTVGVVDTRKKTKLISPQTLSVRNNKKLLTSQDLQSRRQAKHKSKQKRQGSLGSESRAPTRAGLRSAQNPDTLVPESDSSDCRAKGGAEVGANDTGKPSIKRASSEPEPVKTKRVSRVADDPCLSNQCASVVLNGRKATHEAVVSTSADPLGGGDLTEHRLELTALKEGEPRSNSDSEDENIFLTQHDPADMDLCSQMENGNEKLIEIVHGKDTALMEEESWSSTKCKYKDCVEAAQNQGEYCSKHCEAKAVDEDVFRKPGLPPSASKRPSTAKVFSSSSTSRIANLSKSLESTSAPPPALKQKSNGVPAVLKVPQPASVLSPKPVGEVKSLSDVLRPQTLNNSNRQGYKLTFGESRSFSASSAVNVLLSSQSISDTFVKEVLKWKYEMFVNFDQCGPPTSLCQSISRPVPVRFQDCGDYFNVFFPLMILNTFETVAQEWISSPNKEKFYQLHVRKFPADYKKYWEFVVHLEECELTKQLHPKENDLVFLVLEKQNGEKKNTERNRMPDLHEYHCGYVHKFRRTSVMRNGKSECSLSIQTQDNLPLSLNELVKCTVISSLVTTQRKLKAMSLLSGRNQLARAVLNPNPMDFCTKDLLTTTSERIIAYLKDFNEDQKKAIETAYAMVKHSPSVAKICLIHGPPGTGKSKTIVGLLYRLLTENQRKGRSDENSNAKIKQNRVLVCAPSNAAVDELMKKIILEFKEKCKDKKNPLGNCGDINLVRLGPEKSINNEVLRFSLDSQVNHRMKKDLPSHVQEMHRRKEFLDHQLDELSRQRALCRGGKETQRQELDEKIAKVSKERQELASKIKEVQGRPQKTQSIIILESHVICCTLSTSGGLLLESAFRGQGGVPFSCVIVDEAGQSCEVETLTPLIHRCNKLILVGDPKQLPPTVISMKAQEYGYDQSMMARFCKLLEDSVEHNVIGRLPVLQLTVQYRMHPDICLFPSNYVYNRSLKTNRLTETNRCSSDWPFQPYLVFDVGDGSERRDNDSYINVQEIKLVMEIIKLIKDKRRDVTFRNIGIITHYKAQKTMIQKDLDKEFDRKGPAEVDTVDAFQGRQKDCVIVTCVRANAMQGSIGFLASLQRLNVTITRAKYSLFILGHLRTLMENQHWNHLIQDAQKRGAIVKTCDKNYRHDAAKILKLKPVLQRSLTHPPTVAPEVARPQGGLPGSKPDGEFAKTSFPSSLYHVPSGCKESTGAVTTKDPERPPIQDRLRDPRLLRRLGIDPEAKGTCPRDPQPLSPQHPGATPPSGEPGFPLSHQDLGGAQLSTARGTTLSNQNPPVQWEPPAAGTDVAASKRACDWEGGLSRRRETRAFSEGDRETQSPENRHPKRRSGWDNRRLEEEDRGSKRRKFL